MSAIRYPQSFESPDGSDVVLFPVHLLEYEPVESYRMTTAPIMGDYAFDLSGSSPWRKALAEENVRFTILARGNREQDADDQYDELVAKCRRIGRGKLWSLDADGNRRWCYAKLSGKPSKQVSFERPYWMPVEATFQRFSDWYGATPVRAFAELALPTTELVVDVPGNRRTSNVSVRLRAKSRVEASGEMLIQDRQTGVGMARSTNTEGDVRSVPDSSVYIGPGFVNDIVNGNAAVNTTGMSLYNGATGLTRITSDSKFGGTAFEFTYNGGAGEALGTTTPFSVVASGLYAGGAWVKLAVGDTAWIQYQGSGGGVINGGPFTGTGDWQDITLAGAVGATDVTGSLFILVTAGTTGAKRAGGIRFGQAAGVVPYVHTAGSTVTKTAGRLAIRNAKDNELTAAQLADSPIGAWPMVELSGTTAEDFTSNNRDMTHVNTPTLASPMSLPVGDSQGGVLYNGTDEYSSLADNDVWSISKTGQLTVEFVTQLTALPAGTAYIVSKGAGSNYEWQIQLSPGGLLTALVADATGATNLLILTGAAPVLAAGRAYLVTIEFDLYGESGLYVNDELVDTGYLSSPSSYANGTALVNVGRRADAAGFYPGAVKNLAIYDRKLGAERRAAHWEAALAGGLVTPRQGWMIGAANPDWAAAADPGSFPAVFSWMDLAASQFVLMQRTAGDTWSVYNFDGTNIPFAVATGSAHVAGQQLVLGAFWDPSFVRAGVDGRARTAAANTVDWAGKGIALPAHVDIGSRNGASFWFFGRFKRVYMGRGVMSDSEWAAVAALVAAGDATPAAIAAAAPNADLTWAWDAAALPAGSAYWAAPTIRNDTTGQSITLAAGINPGSTAVHDEVLVETGPARVRRSTNDGLVYAGAYGSISKPATQRPLLEADPGENVFRISQTGLPNAGVELEIWPAFES